MKKILLLIIPALLLTGCSYKTTNEKRSSNLSVQVSGSIELQEKCSKGANDFFNSYVDKQDAYDKEYRKNSFSFTNHYNLKLNKCFVLITDDNEPYQFHKTLFDVYENKEWGGIHIADKTIGICGVQVEDIYKTCKSKGEFNDLTKQYMEN